MDTLESYGIYSRIDLDLVGHLHFPYLPSNLTLVSLCVLWYSYFQPINDM